MLAVVAFPARSARFDRSSRTSGRISKPVACLTVQVPATHGKFRHGQWLNRSGETCCDLPRTPNTAALWLIETSTSVVGITAVGNLPLCANPRRRPGRLGEWPSFCAAFANKPLQRITVCAASRQVANLCGPTARS